MTNNHEKIEMIDEAFKPGMRMVDAFVMMYDLVLENGLQDDLRYSESSLILLECRNDLQNLCVKRGNELHEMKKLIDALQEKPLGKYLINKVMKEIES